VIRLAHDDQVALSVAKLIEAELIVPPLDQVVLNKFDTGESPFDLTLDQRQKPALAGCNGRELPEAGWRRFRTRSASATGLRAESRTFKDFKTFGNSLAATHVTGIKGDVRR
jgi:hypothetical protein